jgi:opacity protein-like surface antigen
MKKQVMIVLAGMMVTTPVKAEFFIDVYGGKASTASGNFTGMYSEHTTSILFSETFNSWVTQDDLAGAEGTTYGIRGGYWLESGLGIAVDVSQFDVNPEGSATDISLSPTSFLLLYRYPLLINDGFPRGRLHPYVGAGFSYGSVEVKTYYSDLYDSYDLREDSTCTGLDFRLGLKGFLSRHFAVFAEYRFSALYFEQEAGFQSANSWLLPTATRNHTINNDGDVQTHHLLGGVSWHF